MPTQGIDYLFSGFRLDTRHKRLFDPQGELVTLSARPFDVLLTLVQRSGTLVSRDALMEAVWPRLIVEEHNLTQAICVVRKALNDTTNESQFIRTVPGCGYRFIAPVTEAPLVLCEVEDPVASLGAAASATRRLRTAALSLLLVVLAAALSFVAPSFKASPSTLATPASGPAALARLPNSVAVLPLLVLGAPGDTVFAAGLHDAIITQLTQAGYMNVISRSSILTLAEQGLPTPALIRALRAESVLSGTILFAGAQARINLQLFDERTGLTLWSGTYDIDQHDMAQVIATQDDIALSVGAALKSELPVRDKQNLTALPPALFDAYRFNLAAHKAHDRQDYAAEWRLALKAIERSPDFYEGRLTFASVNVVLVTRPLPGMTSREHAELALAHANRLIAMAPERSEGHALHAVTLAMNRKWEDAAAALGTLATTRAPLADLEYAARVAMTLGDFDGAAAIYEANLASEVLNPYGRGFLMVALELAGRRAQARGKHALGQELHAQWWGESVNVLLALGRNEPPGDVEQLVGISEELRQVLARLDDTAALHAALAAYRHQPVKRPVEARFYAALAARLGEHAVAVELLRTSMQDAWSGMFWTWLPVFDATRREESFRALLRESGLVSYWQQQGWPAMCQPLAADFRCDWSAYPPATLSYAP